MVTRAKAGITKPKIYLASPPISEPHTAFEALSDPKWKMTMQDEYDALLQTGTCMLASHTKNMNLISTRRIFG